MSWIKMTKDTLTHVIETLADKIKAKQDDLSEMTDSEITEMMTGLFTSGSSSSSSGSNLVTEDEMNSALSGKQDILTEMTDSEITEMITDLFYEEVLLEE